MKSPTLIPHHQQILLFRIFAVVLLSIQTALGISLVETNAGVINTDHPQVQTSGGNSPHLLEMATIPINTNSKIDLDVLLADGSPLVMTFEKDEYDSPLIKITLAMVIDNEPCHLEVSLHNTYGPPPIFDVIGAVRPHGVPVNRSESKVIIYHDAPIGVTENAYYGDIYLPGDMPYIIPWVIDISGLGVGETFDIVLRAGPEGDWDDNHIVDLADYEVFFDCVETPYPSRLCHLYFDFNADEVVDLRDFAVFQSVFTGTDTFATCGV